MATSYFGFEIDHVNLPQEAKVLIHPNRVSEAASYLGMPEEDERISEPWIIHRNENSDSFRAISNFDGSSWYLQFRDCVFEFEPQGFKMEYLHQYKKTKARLFKKYAHKFVDRYFKEIFEALDLVYGRKRWDWSIENDYLRPVIYFPEFTITNRDGLEHVITDLYVRLKFDLRGKMKHSLEGVRASISYAEFSTDYAHSHLSGLQGFRFSNFCLGSDSPTVLNLQSLASEFTIEEFEIFLHQIEAMVRWESIEGTPYRYLKNIKEAGQGATPTNSQLRDLYKRFLINTESVEMHPYEYQFGKLYEVRDYDEEVVNFVNRHAHIKGDMINGKFVYRADPLYAFKQYLLWKRNNRPKKPVLKFKGNDVYASMKKPRTVYDEPVKHAHPEYAKFIVKQLNKAQLIDQYEQTAEPQPLWSKETQRPAKAGSVQITGTGGEINSQEWLRLWQHSGIAFINSNEEA